MAPTRKRYLAGLAAACGKEVGVRGFDHLQERTIIISNRVVSISDDHVMRDKTSPSDYVQNGYHTGYPIGVAVPFPVKHPCRVNHQEGNVCNNCCD